MTDKMVNVEEFLLEQAREKEHKNRKKYKYIPDKIEIFSVNDLT